MSESSSALLTDVPASTLLPVLSLPSVVLPGTVITIGLDSDAARLAVEAALADDGKVVLVAPESADIGVVARVPNAGNLPGGQPAAIIQAEGRGRITARHASERGVDRVEFELITDPRPTPRR